MAEVDTPTDRLRRGNRRLVAGVLAVTVVGLAGLFFWDWAADLDNPPGGSVPSDSQTEQVAHELVDGLKTDDRALFMEAATGDAKAGAAAWRLCEPWVSRGHVEWDDVVDPKAPSVFVRVAGHPHQGCYIGVGWQGNAQHAAWSVTGFKGTT